MSILLTNQIQNLSGGVILRSAGSIIQVVQTVKTDTFSTTSTGSWIDVTGMTATITPNSATNKILMRVTMTVSANPVNVLGALRLVRNSTAIGVGDAAS
jgi:hypothetical protein